MVRIAYSTLMARHLGELKTLGWLRISLYWPGMITKMKETCVSCGKCQKVEGRLQVNASLLPMPIMWEPFERVTVDKEDPFPGTKLETNIGLPSWITGLCIWRHLVGRV